MNLNKVQKQNYHSGVSRPRPLSPHLNVFKAEYSSMLSIFHRISGIALAILLLVIGLFSRIMVYNSIELVQVLNLVQINAIFYTFIFYFIFAVLLFCLLYHLSNGVRHLVWDVGIGIKKSLVKSTGLVVLSVAVAMSIIAMYVFG